MPQFDRRPFRPRNNVDLLNYIQRNASSDYRARVQPATQANMTETLSQLWDYRPNRNEFIDALINRIGLVWAKSASWNNKLAKFKRGMLQYGDTIEEIQIGLLKAHVYNANRESLEGELFGTETPDVQSNFHQVNRAEYYKVTVNEANLKRAFLEEGGLSSFVAQMMATPTTSDNWDEFLLMCNLFQEYDDMGGFFNVQVPDLRGIDSDSQDARTALRRIRTLADELQFISTNYNAAGMPVSAEADELELFVSPQVNSALDVDGLAQLFNIDRGRINTRQTLIPQDKFPDGVQAILTTRDFFVVADSVYETTSQPNAAGLTTNYFLHHQEVVSASRFVPAIKFSTLPDTVITISDPKVDSVQDITVANRAGETVTDLPRGDMYYVRSGLNTTPDGSNEGVVLSLRGQTSTFTRLDNSGGLTIGVDEAAAALVITAQASSLYVDEDSTVKPAEATVTLSGDILQFWPNARVIPEAEGEQVTTEAATE
ncbi:major capsid protein [Curtobacterium phage Reje]|uniref:major capsid protein n=1 Tax=Curtobacterium phage Reje TaxID=2851069 RepID=UPI0021FEE167|nr:major capsid protein [Curtobacterium phage Reje]QXG07814.1 major capsid protein [Curtobacterium phage Reje]